MQELHSNLIFDLNPDELVEFDERAAISEYVGGLSREEAEELALMEIISRRKNEGKP